MGKFPFFSGQGILQFVPDTLGKVKLHLFGPNFAPPPPQIPESTKKVKKTVFLEKFQTIHSFFTLSLPYMELSSKFNYTPLSGHYRGWISQNFVFQAYAYPKLWRKNLWEEST